MPLIQYLRRRWVQSRPFPSRWETVLSEHLPVYRPMPNSLRSKLKRRIQVFWDEKIFEECGGLKLTEEMKLIIAAQACLLIMEEPSDYYHALSSVLVYPEDYVAPVYEHDAGGVVTEGWESRSGESWNPGNIVLSWDDIRRDLKHPRDGSNLVYHEFAHQLDYQYGLSADISLEGETESDDPWTNELARTYRQLINKEQRGEADLLDHYGATNPAECFAVVTESFIERPQEFRKEYPELFEHLRSFYGFDPVSLINDK